MAEHTIDEVTLMHPNKDEAIRSVANKIGLNGNDVISAVLDIYHSDVSLYSKLNNAEKEAFLLIGNIHTSRFNAKLEFNQRCEIYALKQSGYSKNEISEIYGINRRTVSHITNERSPHYKSVRSHALGLGISNFVAEYLTQDVVDKVIKYRSLKADMHRKRANHKAGTHVVVGLNCSTPHRVTIAWRIAGEPVYFDGSDPEVIEKDGWYWHDLDGDYPNRWVRGLKDSTTYTSTACFVCMLSEIMDKTA